MTLPDPDETPETTLARLTDGDASEPPGPRFPTVRLREGYEMAAVDAFMADIGRRSREEIQHVEFPTVRLKVGYDMDAVDQELDVWADRAKS